MTHGYYCHAAAISIAVSTTITLHGDANDKFVFVVGGAMTTGAGVRIVLTGGATFDDIFWVVTGAVTLGANSIFQGTIITGPAAAFTLGADAKIYGRAHIGAAVTMGASSSIIKGDEPYVAPVTDSDGYFDMAGCEDFVMLAGAALTIGAGATIHDGYFGYPGPTIDVAGANNTQADLAHFGTCKKHAEAIHASTDVSYCDPLPALVDGLNVTQGYYCHAAAISIAVSTTITLHGDANANFLFVVGGAMTTSAGISIVLIGGATFENIF